MNGDVRLRVMTDLEGRSGGQLSKFFTAHGYGPRYGAPGYGAWVDLFSSPPLLRVVNITEGCFAFVACFSGASVSKPKSDMNEELSPAREQLRPRNTTNWFVPVMLTEWALPDFDIGLHGRLTDIEQCRLYVDWHREATRLLTAMRRRA